MKNIILTLSFIVVIITSSFSQVIQEQTPTDAVKQQDTYYKAPVDIETTDLKIEFLETVSQSTFTKVKVKITNKTNDFIIFKLSETTFTSAKGEFSVEGKDLIIAPMSDETKSLMVKGESGFDVNEFTMTLQGFSKVPMEGRVQSKPQVKGQGKAVTTDYSLSAPAKLFAIDSFHCTYLGMTKVGNVLEAHFKCIYNGEYYGILQTSKMVLRTANGQEYTNEDKRVEPRIMASGKKENFKLKFTLPAEVINSQNENLLVDWQDTFTENGKTELSDNSTFELTLKTEAGAVTK